MTYDNARKLYQRNIMRHDSAVYFHHKAVKALAQDFERGEVSQSPKPGPALEKNELTKYLCRKAEALARIGQEENALETYAVAATCAKLAILEADREQDKLDVAARTQAAYFLRGKQEKE